MRLSFFNSLITPGRMNWVKWAWTKHSVRSRKNPHSKRHLKQHIRDKEMKPWRTKWCLCPTVYKQQKLLSKTQELQKSSLITVDFLSCSRLIRPQLRGIHQTSKTIPVFKPLEHWIAPLSRHKCINRIYISSFHTVHKKPTVTVPRFNYGIRYLMITFE